VVRGGGKQPGRAGVLGCPSVENRDGWGSLSRSKANVGQPIRDRVETPTPFGSVQGRLFAKSVKDGPASQWMKFRYESARSGDLIHRRFVILLRRMVL
jgi:hypothetical protein